MRVLLSPRAGGATDERVLSVAQALAREEGSVERFMELPEGAFHRKLSSREIHLLRSALAGFELDRRLGAGEPPASVVGYVCVARAARPGVEGAVVAVTDHVNLAWCSPLTGPNDERWGPRFPVAAGLYASEIVCEALRPQGSPPFTGVIAGVRDDRQLLAFEERMGRELDWPAVSSELVPVALLAAHMGLRLAAAAVVAG